MYLEEFLANYNCTKSKTEKVSITVAISYTKFVL